MSTILVVTLFFALMGTEIFLWAWFLRFGLHWAKVQNVPMRPLALATCLVFTLRLLLAVISGLITTVNPIFANSVTVAQIIAAVLIPCCVILLVFKIGFLRSLQAWLPTLVSAAIAVLILRVVIRPFIIEPCTVPTNAMAPTLIGRHWRGTCADCGNRAFCTPAIPEFPEPPTMICGNFHTTQPINYDDREFKADRFLVAKFLTPRRWDLIVFRYPEEPSILYVKRLIGLPGEEITIRDGQVWANGIVLTPPEHIREIKYLSKIDDWGEPLWGSPERPAKLAHDEYFVLGDFSSQSKDSRLWEHGAPGHPPYAVPKSYLRGVVIHIYWPPTRWRVFR